MVSKITKEGEEKMIKNQILYKNQMLYNSKKEKEGREKSNSTNNLIAERSEERSSSINYGK